MNEFKLLIDTNVVIGLEDDHEVEHSFAQLRRKWSEYGVRMFVHETAYDDIRRDTNLNRRKITLSKLEKFERLGSLPSGTTVELAVRFGPINSQNDLCDVQLLNAIDRKAANFLITQDADIHRRAERAGLGTSVLTVEDASQWIIQTFEPREVPLPSIRSRKAYAIDRSDPLFDSLREGYPNFDAWFEKCAATHRDCWVVEVRGELAGVIIRKDEQHAEAETKHRGPKILKLCTFKMKPKFRGQKYGEQMLKKALWFA